MAQTSIHQAPHPPALRCCKAATSNAELLLANGARSAPLADAGNNERRAAETSRFSHGLSLNRACQGYVALASGASPARWRKHEPGQRPDLHRSAEPWDLDFSIAPPASYQTNSCQTKVKRSTTRRAQFSRLHTIRCAPVAPDSPYGASVPLQWRAAHFNDGISQASKRNFFAISGKPVDTIVDQVSAALPAAAA